ncbi:MAG TPA: transglycosylase SLT domain-containing protein [Acetobacteraceae bacterium]|nr:transglycosylase SLT domain-containing protein [Acetobacteraceae bacterium]
MRLLLALCWLLLLPVASWAAPLFGQASPSALCRNAIAAAERASGVPDRLMQAIGIVESGRADERGGVTAWPWTINVEGVGYVFDTKAEAIAAVNAHRARGARSIDVGCMQVNLLHHGDAFASLEEAFDPATNARYAAAFLQRLLAQTGSWPRAAAGYHSLTPDIGGEYARKVLAVWARPGLGPSAPELPRFANSPFAATAPTAPFAGNMALQGSATARIIPLSGSSPSGTVGRGLDAYRAAPTQLATSAFLRRG